MSPVMRTGWKGDVQEQGEQGGEQSHAANDGKCKWKAGAYRSYLIDFHIILRK